jgi:hypothetical protein
MKWINDLICRWRGHVEPTYSKQARTKNPTRFIWTCLRCQTLFTFVSFKHDNNQDINLDAMHIFYAQEK